MASQNNSLHLCIRVVGLLAGSRGGGEGIAGGKPSMIAVVIKYRASSSVPKEAAALRAKPV